MYITQSASRTWRRGRTSRFIPGMNAGHVSRRIDLPRWSGLSGGSERWTRDSPSHGAGSSLSFDEVKGESAPTARCCYMMRRHRCSRTARRAPRFVAGGTHLPVPCPRCTVSIHARCPNATRFQDAADDPTKSIVLNSRNGCEGGARKCKCYECPRSACKQSQDGTRCTGGPIWRHMRQSLILGPRQSSAQQDPRRRQKRLLHRQSRMTRCHPLTLDLVRE